MLSDLFVFAVQNGLPQDTLLFLLLLPAVAALVIFFRVVIGVEYLQLNRAIFLALGVASLGMYLGIFFFLASIVLDIGIRSLLEGRRLLPPAKYALVLLFTMLILLAFLILAGYFSKPSLVSLSIIPILLIIVNAQGMLQISPGDSMWRPFAWLLQMFIFLYGSFLLLTMPSIQEFALRSPSLYVGILVIVMLILGRYRGLRVSEFFRFFKVISKPEP